MTELYYWLQFLNCETLKDLMCGRNFVPSPLTTRTLWNAMLIEIIRLVISGEHDFKKTKTSRLLAIYVVSSLSGCNARQKIDGN